MKDMGPNHGLVHEETTSAIIGAFYDVYNTLGHGFLERVYQNALAQALAERGLTVWLEAPISVLFHGKVVGEYVADLLVDNCVIVEPKVADVIHPTHMAQLNNYLKATNVEVGLLLNFGPRESYRRTVLTNDHKPEPRPMRKPASA